MSSQQNAKQRCKALTETGKPCQYFAGKSGYCVRHDPAKAVERENAAELAEQKRKPEQTQRNKLHEILDIVTSTCKTRGWSLTILHLEPVMNFRY